MLSEVTFFWVMFGLVLLVLVLSCMILCYLPFCVDKAEYHERISLRKKQELPITDNTLQPNQMTGIKIGDAITNKKQPPISSFYGTNRRRQLHHVKQPSTHMDEFGENDKSKELRQYVEKIRETILISFQFKTAFDAVLFALTIIYPPSLWIIWAFFPINSTSVLSILFFGSKLLASGLLYYCLNLLSDNWLHKIKYSPQQILSTSEIKNDMRTLIVGSTMWSFGLYMYIFLRILGMYLGAGILLLDGWIIISILAFIDLLFLIFPLTIM